jgi:hypothetical protein|tara:strand:- start:1748 stop:3475 length:1728 start_codon:yes stop_codon:yes gene_type:complete
VNQDNNEVILDEIYKNLRKTLDEEVDTDWKSIIKLFLIITKNEQLNEVSKVLSVRFIDKNFEEFDSVRLVLVTQVETYFKIVTNKIDESFKGELKSCLVNFFNNNDYLSNNKDSYRFFAKKGLDKIPIYPSYYFENKMPFGKRLNHMYNLRNALLHNGFLCNGVKPSTENLLYDINSILISILFILSKYSKQLNKFYDNGSENKQLEYLEKVINNYINWRSKFIHIIGKEDTSVFDPYGIEISIDKSNDINEREGSIDNLRNNEVYEKRMFIWADAGMGKTTTLQYIAYRDANKIVDGNSNIPIPIYIPLKLQCNPDITLEETIFSLLSISSQKGYELLINGKITLLLDGINEIIKNVKEKIINEINQIINNYPKTFIIITTRPQTFNQFENIPIFQLQRMKEKQIKLFLKKNTAQSEVRELILSEIDKSSSLRKMINIPLMLWMLIKVVEASRRVPITKTIIIEYFMDMLFKREASKDANFNIDENFSMLRSLGLESYNINETNGGLSKVQIENILVKKKKEYGLKISIPSFIEVMVRLNILSLEENLYSFSHQEYQTYLAGEELDIDDFIETS